MRISKPFLLNDAQPLVLEQLHANTVIGGRMRYNISLLKRGELENEIWILMAYRHAFVGWSSLEAGDNRILLSVFVRRYARKQNIGKELAKKAIEFVENNERLSKKYIWSDSWNRAGRAFYKSLNVPDIKGE